MRRFSKSLVAILLIAIMVFAAAADAGAGYWFDGTYYSGNTGELTSGAYSVPETDITNIAGYRFTVYTLAGVKKGHSINVFRNGYKLAGSTGSMYKNIGETDSTSPGYQDKITIYNMYNAGNSIELALHTGWGRYDYFDTSRSTSFSSMNTLFGTPALPTSPSGMAAWCTAINMQYVSALCDVAVPVDTDKIVVEPIYRAKCGDKSIVLTIAEWAVYQATIVTQNGASGGEPYGYTLAKPSASGDTWQNISYVITAMFPLNMYTTVGIGTTGGYWGCQNISVYENLNGTTNSYSSDNAFYSSDAGAWMYKQSHSVGSQYINNTSADIINYMVGVGVYNAVPESSTYAVTVNLKLNNSTYTNSDTKTITLRQSGTTKYTLTQTNKYTYTYNAASTGSYDIFVNGKDTGTDVTVSNADVSATLNYYSAVTVAGAGITNVYGSISNTDLADFFLIYLDGSAYTNISIKSDSSGSSYSAPNITGYYYGVGVGSPFVGTYSIYNGTTDTGADIIFSDADGTPPCTTYTFIPGGIATGAGFIVLSGSATDTINATVASNYTWNSWSGTSAFSAKNPSAFSISKAYTETASATTTANTYAATVYVQINGQPYTAFGTHTVTLKQSGTVKYTMTQSSDKASFTSSVVNGTYDIFLDGVDTGDDITISSAPNSAYLFYYTFVTVPKTGVATVSATGSAYSSFGGDNSHYDKFILLIDDTTYASHTVTAKYGDYTATATRIGSTNYYAFTPGLLFYYSSYTIYIDGVSTGATVTFNTRNYTFKAGGKAIGFGCSALFTKIYNSTSATMSSGYTWGGWTGTYPDSAQTTGYMVSKETIQYANPTKGYEIWIYLDGTSYINYPTTTLTLRQNNTVKYTATQTAMMYYYSGTAATGTYDIYLNGSDSGFDLVVGETGYVYYYTVTLNAGEGINSVSITYPVTQTGVNSTSTIVLKGTMISANAEIKSNSTFTHTENYADITITKGGVVYAGQTVEIYNGTTYVCGSTDIGNGVYRTPVILTPGTAYTVYVNGTSTGETITVTTGATCSVTYSWEGWSGTEDTPYGPSRFFTINQTTTETALAPSVLSYSNGETKTVNIPIALTVITRVNGVQSVPTGMTNWGTLYINDTLTGSINGSSVVYPVSSGDTYSIDALLAPGCSAMADAYLGTITDNTTVYINYYTLTVNSYLDNSTASSVKPFGSSSTYYIKACGHVFSSSDAVFNSTTNNFVIPVLVSYSYSVYAMKNSSDTACSSTITAYTFMDASAHTENIYYYTVSRRCCRAKPARMRVAARRCADN